MVVISPNRILVPTLVLFAACAPDWTDPTVSLESFSVAEVNLTGATVELQLSFYNPNAEDLPFEAVEYEIRIGESGPVSGTATFDQPLPALRSVSVPSTMHITAASSVSIVSQLAQGRRDYHLNGIMTVQYYGRRRVAFERDGELGARNDMAPP